MFYFSDGHTAGIEGQMSVDPELFKTIVRWMKIILITIWHLFLWNVETN
jgi:hypothetical protein